MSGIVGVLNQPAVKQGIKNFIGLVTCTIGVHALYGAMKGKIYTKYAAIVPAPTGSKSTDEFRSTVDKVALACAQFSFVLSATVTPLGVWGISSIVTRVFSTAQLGNVFGPNTIFESNWKHPRHIVSLAAVGLAIPLIMKRMFVPEDPATAEKQRTLGTFAYWVVLTSRPVLHLGNQLAQRLFK